MRLLSAGVPVKPVYVLPDPDLSGPGDSQIASPACTASGSVADKKSTAPMISIELSPEEIEGLGQILQDWLASLELEIIYTGQGAAKDALEHRHALVQGLLAKLSGQAFAGARSSQAFLPLAGSAPPAAAPPAA
jgi:hypothetical protein